jgi:cytochrome c oxidase cbb3-type subunit III
VKVLRRMGCVSALQGFALIALGAFAQDTQDAVNREMARPMILGGIVYKDHCMACHGERGDGASNAAPSLSTASAASLAIKPRSADYYDKIVRKGGDAVGASKSMPAWQDKLSQEQIAGVIAFLGVLSDPVRRGEVVFKTNCVLCHGIAADGKGRAATLFNPSPADLTRSDKSDEYKARIITSGGQALGRSKAMPGWGGRLSESEIEDVVKYLRTVLANPSSL